MYRLKLFFLSIGAIFLFDVIVFAQGNSQIEGKVITEKRAPVNNAFVELYNDFDLLIGRSRSSSQGRFTFRNLSPGRYIIRVRPFGTNLQEGTERIELKDLLGNTPDFVYVEISLEVDRRFERQNETIIGTIYAQEIPDDAKRLFESGSKKLNSKDEKGFADLESAIKIFPQYFDALSKIGVEYVARNKYKEGYPFLLKAIDVYPRCPECYYSLGVAFYRLDQFEAGVRAARAAVALKPNSGETQLLLGILLRINKNLTESETALLEAKKLFKNPNPEVHWQLALLYNSLSKNNEAADELETYLKIKPDADKKRTG